MGRRFWVGCGFFSWGGGGGEEDSPGQVLQSHFHRRRAGSNRPIFYVIHGILSSGGFTAACVRPSRTDPDPRCPGQHALFKLGQLDDTLPHTEDSEGNAALRSVTDSTEQVVFGYIPVYANDLHLIYIGVYPHKYIGHEDNVQTGGVVRVRYVLFNAHLCNHIILLHSGGGT
jgi:hypothetical protein